MSRTPWIALIALSLAISPSLAEAKKKKKKKGDEPPPVGWQVEEGWTHSCYFPPDWGALGEGDRKVKRAAVLDEMLTQWRGERDAAVTFKEDHIESVEITLLGRTSDVEGVARKNLDFCKASAAGGDTAAWGSWLKGLPAQLTEGECLTPFDFTLFDYLDIGAGWQREMPICQDDKVKIWGTASDKYRIEEGGPWVTVEGNPEQPTAGSEDYPCNLAGCLAGMLVMKFTTEKGIETIYPVGKELVFLAPEHGTISYRINDVKFYDNIWYQSGSLIDHTAITIEPAQ